jgi:hypothetical protein
MASDLARATAVQASHDVGQRETDGPNDSPRIRQYQATTNAQPGSPYCASAICTWVQEAGFRLGCTPNLRFSASACKLYFLNPGRTILSHALTTDDIPCIGVLDHGGGKGHAYLAVGYDSATGQLQTIEANSNGGGAREGQGVFRT